MFSKITVLGAGTMGHGIAHVCAMAGYRVVLYDISAAVLENAMNSITANLNKGIAIGKVSEAGRNLTLSNISTSDHLSTAVANSELIIEAVPENLELKRSLLAQVDQLTEESTIIGTNTSSISISEIATAVSDPTRVIGLHFFNPVHVMKLLEIVYHPTTGNDVIGAMKEFACAIKKTSILVKNSPGFATSRLGVLLGMEAIRMLQEGVATAEDIDTAMVLGYKHPVGPLKLTDMVGLDVRMAIGSYLAAELNQPAFEPPRLMRELVEQGKLGKKSGEGFYRW